MVGQQLHSARDLYDLRFFITWTTLLPRGCLDLGATWTYKKKRRVPGVPGDSSLSYLYLLHHTAHTGASFYIGGTTHNSRRYDETTRTTKSARAHVYRSKPVDNARDETRRRRRPRARIECAHTRHTSSTTSSLAHTHARATSKQG